MDTRSSLFRFPREKLGKRTRKMNDVLLPTSTWCASPTLLGCQNSCKECSGLMTDHCITNLSMTVTRNTLVRQLECSTPGSVSILMINIPTMLLWNTPLQAVIIMPWMTPRSQWQQTSASQERSPKPSTSTKLGTNSFFLI